VSMNEVVIRFLQGMAVIQTVLGVLIICVLIAHSWFTIVRVMAIM